MNFQNYTQKSMEAVQEATGAGTHCGGCVSKVEELIEQFK